MRRWLLHSVIALSIFAQLFLADSGDSAAPESARSWPKDTRPQARPAVPEDYAPGGQGAFHLPPVPFNIHIVDAVVSNTDPTLTTMDTFVDWEPSIAVNPRDPDEIVITTFSGSWGATAPLWLSTDRGRTWTKQFTIPAPPGVPAVGPRDQTVDYGRQHQLAGTFLVGPNNNLNVYSGTTTDPSDADAWDWFVINGVTQRTNNNVPSSFGNVDQPWLLVNRDPRVGHQDNVYVAYDDFNGGPDMRVAVAQDTGPLNFTIDRFVGVARGGTLNPINPGHRLATDPRTGIVYSLFQRGRAAGAGGSENIDYMLNRSTDGGRTWILNGSATGIVVANADSNQARPKFCTINALLGGVLHAAVDPHSGDLFYVYGNRDPTTGNNRLALRRITDNGAGGVSIGPEVFVTGQVQAAIPAVAVAVDGTVGVFYYTCDGFSSDGFPVLTAHVTLSNDLGQTFTDLGLLTFLSAAQDSCPAAPAPNDPCLRQRELGDYTQMKTVGLTFYGAFTGNGVPFGRPFANHDPIFFRFSVVPGLALFSNPTP
jgi:hypothetical protein